MDGISFQEAARGRLLFYQNGGKIRSRLAGSRRKEIQVSKKEVLFWEGWFKSVPPTSEESAHGVIQVIVAGPGMIRRHPGSVEELCLFLEMLDLDLSQARIPEGIKIAVYRKRDKK
ncbi:hypothetical protein KGM48_00615 [Patescibacteria group bacterium]|nr:hypothetical protein [Patescibacteria group bacterium]